LFPRAGVCISRIHDDAHADFPAARCALTFTGAAQNLMVVNIPATPDGISETIKREIALLPFLRALAGTEFLDVAKKLAAALKQAERRSSRESCESPSDWNCWRSFQLRVGWLLPGAQAARCRLRLARNELLVLSVEEKVAIASRHRPQARPGCTPRKCAVALRDMFTF